MDKSGFENTDWQWKKYIIWDGEIQETISK